MPYPAHFNDGNTTARLDAHVSLQNGELLIADMQGTVVARWPLGKIRSAGTGMPIRLQCGGDARLTLGDDDDGTWLTRQCPNLKRRTHAGPRWPVWLAAVILAAASVAGIFVYLLPSIAGTVARLVPVTLEQRIGTESRNQILAVLARLQKADGDFVCRNTAAQDILNKRAKELATVMDSPFALNVTVVRFPIANAITLPGGQVIILSGLLDEAKSGDEVIGVLAHEIAHVVRRDPLQVTLKQTGTALLVSLMIGDVFGGAVLAGSAQALIDSGYSRDAEAAADMLAVTALNQLGLTARPLADFVERMSKLNPVGALVPDFLSTHPSGAARHRDILAASQGAGRALSQYEWAAVKNMCGKKDG